MARAANGVQALAALLEYAFRVGEVRPEDVRLLAKELGPAATEAYMTAAAILTKESYAEGKAEGKAELLLRLLGLRFGSLSAAHRDTVLRASAEQIDVWAERLLSGASIEEILG